MHFERGFEVQKSDCQVLIASSKNHHGDIINPGMRVIFLVSIFKGKESANMRFFLLPNRFFFGKITNCKIFI